MDRLLSALRTWPGALAGESFGDRLAAAAREPLRSMTADGRIIEVSFAYDVDCHSFPALIVRVIDKNARSNQEARLFVISGPGDYLELSPYRFIDDQTGRDEIFARLEPGLPPELHILNRPEWARLTSWIHCVCEEFEPASSPAA